MCADCSFDFGLCLWTQYDTDDFDWTWKKGATKTAETGPRGDHTTGHGFYIYIETTGANKTQKARVTSPLQNSGKYCLSFWYYMYGLHVDVLRVFIVDERWKTTEIDIISGNQGDKWIERNTYIHSAIRFWITIEGKFGNRTANFLGDIAVDDIVMLHCQDCDNPSPTHGQVNPENFQHGSAVEISCNSGYRLSGNESIVCQSDGRWSARSTCEPECGDPTPTHGVANSINFKYGSVIEITCHVGYNINGSSVISCQADGTWTYSPTCYHIVIEITCNVGYNISGRSVISCKADGTWTDYPTYCGTRKITNGEFIAVSGTTFGQTATQSCKSGYTFKGDIVVTCTESGWNATAVTCEIADSGNTSALIAVYVVVSVVATALFIILLAVIWRKCISRGGEKEQAIQGSQNTDTHTTSFSNVEALQSNPGSTYTDLINHSYVNAIQSQEHEYSSIKTDGNDKRTDEKSVYYNTVETVVSQQ